MGKWVLAGSNTFTGTTTISGGILAVSGILAVNGAGQLYAGSTTGSSIITVSAAEPSKWIAGTWAGQRRARNTLAGAGSFGNLAGTSGQLLINGGTIMYAGNTNDPNTNSSDSRGFTIEGSGATLDAVTAGQTWYINNSTGSNTILASSISSGGVSFLNLEGAGNGEIDEAIPTSTPAMGLTMSGTGTWTLTGVNKYTGATTLSSGTLVMGSTTSASTALSTSAVTLSTANNGLQFASGVTSASLGSLAGGGNIVLQNNTGSPAMGAAVALTVGGNNTPLRPSTPAVSAAQARW